MRALPVLVAMASIAACTTSRPDFGNPSDGGGASGSSDSGEGSSDSGGAPADSKTGGAPGEGGLGGTPHDTTCLGKPGTANCEGECTPDQTKCDGNNGLQTCDSSGQYGPADGCEDQTCVGPSGSASCEGECAPDQTKCDSHNGLQSCDSSGQYGVGVVCENSTCLGEDGNASCQGSCAPGQLQCSGNGWQPCDATTGEFGSVTGCASASPHCVNGVCGSPPSCQGLAANCGSSANESCCASLEVDGGSFNRIDDASYPAKIDTFRLDKFEVTVGRWRKFVGAWDGGWHAPGTTGKHVHLNNGDGLENSHTDSAYESGWNPDWEGNVDTSGTARQVGGTYATWTTSTGMNENRPINYVNWYESYAFCIWDGGFLPSEAEWNYAAAAGGAQRQYPWGPDAPTCGMANFSGETGGAECNPNTHTINVGVTSGNGLYGQEDLAGNLWEWILDVSATPTIAFGTTCNNCAYLPSTAPSRVTRGASFIDGAASLLTSTRDSTAPVNRSPNYGLRCARVK